MQKEEGEESSLGVHWLRLHASEAGGAGSVPGWGTESSRALETAKNK